MSNPPNVGADKKTADNTGDKRPAQQQGQSEKTVQQGQPEGATQQQGDPLPKAQPINAPGDAKR